MFHSSAGFSLPRCSDLPITSLCMLLSSLSVHLSPASVYVNPPSTPPAAQPFHYPNTYLSLACRVLSPIPFHSCTPHLLSIHPPSYPFGTASSHLPCRTKRALCLNCVSASWQIEPIRLGEQEPATLADWITEAGPANTQSCALHAAVAGGGGGRRAQQASCARSACRNKQLTP